ncbi:MAG: hypothetical protein E7000_05120 [Coriobacteriaceae bacterium]|nr:hypothetical protein [Coriobacteriaceae bacterium]
MKGIFGLFGSEKKIFAGKQRLHGEPFCPFVTNDTGYQALRANRTAQHNPGSLGNTGSFGPITDFNQKRPPNRTQYW